MVGRFLALLMVGLVASTSFAATIWVEGEDATHAEVQRHRPWYDQVQGSELSGGDWISNWSSDRAGQATYWVNVPEAGVFYFYLRANPTQTDLRYKINDAEWQKLDTSLAFDRRNVAKGGAVDLRFVAWFDLGKVQLNRGRNAITFRMESKNHYHGAIDCFTFVDEPFKPHSKAKPGEARERVETPAGTWGFEPDVDRFSEDALLDLRSLNEATAGEHGFIKVDEAGDFVRGDGQPIRFWGVTTEVYKQGPAALRDHARFLAKRGINMVRWHGNVPRQKEGSDLRDIDEKARQGLWQLVAAMRGEGIYTTISPYYAHATKNIPKSWGIDSPQENMTGLVFFDPRVQDAYKAWLRAVFEPKNPYTGIALKDDPSVAIIQIQNEDSLLFWTISAIKGGERRLLEQRFGEWATARYGSIDAAMEAWDGNSVEGDAAAEGRLGLKHIWDATSSARREKRMSKGELQRVNDQMQFYTELMRDWNAEVVRFLREDIGAPQVVNAGNWRTADTLLLDDLERYSYTTTEVMGLNRYMSSTHEGKHRGWAIVNGDRLINTTVLGHPQSLPVAVRQVAGKAYILPESQWVPPNLYQSEGPFLTAAMCSLTGVDLQYWFTVKEPQWRPPSSANGYLPSLGKWNVNTPEQMGNFPAAALAFRKGYIKRGEPVVHEHRSLESLWRRELPVISRGGSFDPNRDLKDMTSETLEGRLVSSAAFAAGPVLVSYDSDPAKTFVHPKLDELIDEDAKVVRSITGEIEWDYGKAICKIDAPKAKGVSGFLDRQKTFAFEGMTIKSTDPYATIMVVSLDDQPLATSRKVLVQVGTTARSLGWKDRPVTVEKDGKKREMREIVSYGGPPWVVTSPHAELTLDNSRLSEAVTLDPNGMPTVTQALQRSGSRVRLQLPADAKYVVLREKE